MIVFIKKAYLWFMPFWKKLNRDNIFAIAAQTAFFIILSAVPLTMFLMSLLQGFNLSPEMLKQLIGSEAAEDQIVQVLNSLTCMYDQTVGISLVSIIATLWSAAKGVHAITNGLNRIHDTYENRNWFAVRIRAMLHTFLFLLIIVLTISIILLGSMLSELVEPYLGKLPGYIAIIYSLRYVIIFIYQVTFFAVLYCRLPNLSRVRRREFSFRCQLPGALFCAVSWHVLMFAISIYVTDFNGFSIYKGLTQLAVIMIFMYFCMVCMMIGAEINVYFHKEIDWFTRFLSFKYLRNRRRMRKRAKKREKENRDKKDDNKAAEDIKKQSLE